MGYINANRISELIESRLDGLEFMSKDRAEAYEMAIRAALRVIEHAPTADVQEVVHGECIKDLQEIESKHHIENEVGCQLCNGDALKGYFVDSDSYGMYIARRSHADFISFKYCPLCGSEIRREF